MQEVEPKPNNKTRQRWWSPSDWWIVAAVALLACGLVVLYFQKLVPSAPVEAAGWGQFGDFVGGLTNPLIGLATVLLVVLTLRTTRQEAKFAGEQLLAQSKLLREQVELAGKEHRLNEIKKRLDGVLASWNALLDRPAGTVMKISSLGTDWNDTLREPLREFFYSKELLENFRAAPREAGFERAREFWKKEYSDLVWHLDELAAYCAEYEKESGERGLTDFYRRRVDRVVRLLRAAEVIGMGELRSLDVGVEVRFGGLGVAQGPSALLHSD